MKYSVALCTYNGKAYLAEQLQSILQQTILPSQIVVCDDCSTDETNEIVSTFVRNNPKIRWKHEINENNVGVAKNFEKSISLCDEEIVFLSDQDDVWLQNKAETILKCFMAENCLAIFTNAKIVDEKLLDSGITLFEWIKFNRSDQKMFNNSKYGRFLFFSKFVATGATMAFKKSLADKTFPLPSNRFYIHDFWIIVMGSCFGKVSFINEPLILYRQHDQQLIGAKTAKPEILSEIVTQKKTDKLIDFLIDKRGKEIIVLDSFNKHHNSITEDEQAILEIRIRLMDSLINKPASFFQRLKLIRFALYKYKIPEFYSLRLFIGNSINYVINR